MSWISNLNTDIISQKIITTLFFFNRYFILETFCRFCFFIETEKILYSEIDCTQGRVYHGYDHF